MAIWRRRVATALAPSPRAWARALLADLAAAGALAMKDGVVHDL